MARTDYTPGSLYMSLAALTEEQILAGRDRAFPVMAPWPTLTVSADKLRILLQGGSLGASTV